MKLPSGFNIDLAIALANLSNETYKQYQAYKNGASWEKPIGYKIELTFYANYEDGKLPLGFIATKNNNIYICWRGTITFEEWIEDAKFEQIACSFLPNNINVELGFHQIYSTEESCATALKRRKLLIFSIPTWFSR